MEIIGKVVTIDMAKSCTGPNGEYTAWRLDYIDSKTNEEKFFQKHQMTLKKVKGLKEALLALSAGDTFTATMEKEGKYWEIKEIRKGGHVAPSNSPGSAGGNRNDPVVQTQIVRQNALSHATAIVCQFGSNPDLDQNVDEITRLATKLEEWIIRENHTA